LILFDDRSGVKIRLVNPAVQRSSTTH